MRLSQIKNLLLRSLLRSTPGSWIRSNFETLLITILKMGPVPDHVAFIMDGNRRFAKQNRINLDQAYMLGAETLERVGLFL